MPGVLVIGAGGREHALAWKLKQSSQVDKVHIAPGNAADFVSAQDLDIDNADAIVAYCTKNGLDLVVVGPEAPLAAGLVDRLSGRVAVFGASKKGAELEASKAFSKQFMQEQKLPTARFEVFDNPDKATRFIESCDWDGVVVKADGLAAGKGVVVAENKQEAVEAVRSMLAGQFGASSARVVLEERLFGYEVSALAFTDGQTVVRMPLVRDHKRLLDGDRGPNTGGMGVVGPVQVPADVDRQIDDILQRTVDGLRLKGIPYRGVLYAGLLVTRKGAHLLEYNCRFGDPETETKMLA